MSPETPDLIATLERVEKESKRALARLKAGEALNGTGSFKRIQDEARDALVRAGVREPTAA